MTESNHAAPAGHLAAILRVAGAVSAEQNPAALLPAVVEHIRSNLGYDASAILLAEGDDLVVRASTYAPAVIVGERVRGGNGITGRAATTRQACVVGNTETCSFYLQIGADRFASELAVPILYRNRLLGVIDAQRARPGAIDEADVLTLTIVATYLGFVLHNARIRTQLSLVQAIGLQLVTIMRTDELFPWIVSELSGRLGWDSNAILRVDGHELVVEAATGAYGDDVIGRRIPVTHGITGRCARTRQCVNVADTRNDPEYIGGGIRALSEIAAPVLFERDLYGVLTVESPHAEAFDDDDVQLLATLSAQLAVALRQARMFQESEDRAVTDALTGLYNHRYFYERLQGEIGRCARFGRPLALVLVDLDDFKQINDRFGHLAGDEVLRTVARTLKANIRSYDESASVRGDASSVASRYGGEEFVLIMPETGADGAAVAAERVRATLQTTVAAVARAANGTETPLRVTGSFGVAVWEPGLSTEQLIARADEATYRAKAAGKNVVVVWTPPA